MYGRLSAANRSRHSRCPALAERSARPRQPQRRQSPATTSSESADDFQRSLRWHRRRGSAAKPALPRQSPQAAPPAKSSAQPDEYSMALEKADRRPENSGAILPPSRPPWRRAQKSAASTRRAATPRPITSPPAELKT